jgi:hypothetical protein
LSQGLTALPVAGADPVDHAVGSPASIWMWHEIDVALKGLLQQVSPQHLMRRPSRKNLTLLHQDDVMGDIHDLIEVMKHRDDRKTFLCVEFAQEGQQFGLVSDVEKARGLIKKKDARLLRQSHRQPSSLPFTAGQGRELPRTQILKADAKNGAFDNPAVPCRQSTKPGTVRITALFNEFFDAQADGNLWCLAQDGNLAGDGASRQRVERLPGQADFAFRRVFESGEAFEKRAFTGAVRAAYDGNPAFKRNGIDLSERLSLIIDDAETKRLSRDGLRPLFARRPVHPATSRMALRREDKLR